MVSLKIYTLLLVVIFAMFNQSYARVWTNEDVQDMVERLVRPRRSPHHPGVTGPVHTFVKTDKHANFKWGVRHHVGHKYSGN